MKEKIGIITHYHQSRNYGGVLQAYALTQYLMGAGYDAKQICYLMGAEPVLHKRSIRRTMELVKRYRIKSTVHILLFRTVNRILSGKFRKCAEAFESFNQYEIPHSKVVYTRNTIQTCTSYDIYITGSDQVWNPDWYEPAFFLEFVPEGKKKIAYAASLGHGELTAEQTACFREKLRDYAAVSVREEDAAALLAPLSPVPVEWVVDPVLLLTREQWEGICSPRMIQEPYLFCYFLGTSSEVRKLAAAFARRHGLKLVFLPYIHGVFQRCDLGFGNVRLFNVSPKDFLSLIKYADFVFTDSFHATVFSELYRTAYVVFRRDPSDSMTSRIYSVVSLFEDAARFCDDDEKENLEYIENLPPMEQDKQFPLLETMREKSRAFLENHLKNG